MKVLRATYFRATTFALLISSATAFCFCTVPAHAAPQQAPSASATPETERKALLRSLANQFNKKIAPALRQADLSLSPDLQRTEKQQRAYDGLVDGEILLLSGTLREAKSLAASPYKIQEPITAVKQGHDAYISLADFSHIAGFSIRIDENGNADGWYMSEDRPFSINSEALTVTRDDQTEQLQPNDLLVQDGDIYVRSAVMEKWFNLDARIEPNAQIIALTTYEQLPLQARLLRQQRRNTRFTRSKPEKPRLVEEYTAYTLPRADVALNQQVESRGDGSEPDNYSQYSVIATNQLLNHEMTTFTSGTIASNKDRNPLEQLRINFRKESENNDLVGPLEAKVYEFNDLVPAYVPYTGSASTERGVRISNQSNRYTSDTETTIDGDAQPGWDVELYRNSVFLGGVIVDETGRYSFDRISLFAGDNIFKIIFFGPQGEQREEQRIVTVLPTLVGDIKGYYNASLSQKDTITYRASDYETQDTGTLRFSGIYDRRVSDNLTLRGGLHSRETAGQRDNYFYSGAVGGVGSAILNADLVTTSDGPFRALLTGRQRFGLHNATVGLDYQSADFNEGYIDDTVVVPQQENAYFRLTGPFMREVYSRVTYDTGMQVRHNEYGEINTQTDFGLSSSFMGMSFDNEIELVTDSADRNDRQQVLTYSGGARGRYNGYNWRGRLQYEIIPSAEPDTFNINASRNFTRNLSGFGDLDHRFQDSLSIGTLGLTYMADYARISPQVSYDTDNNVQAKLNINFSVAKDPYSDDVVMSSTALTTKGGLSIFAFLDKSGNGVFDGDDEPLQDVVINAVQHSITMMTNEDGIAFNSNVPTNRVSDITMEVNSAFEPTWVPGYEGAAVRVRPSEVIRMEFPVLRGAEIDGTAYIARTGEEPAAARNVTLNLITPDGAVLKSTTTPFDGFYILEAVRPGVYYFTTDSSQSPVPAYRTPEKLVITPDGAQIYGKNITLTRGYDIPFHFSASNTNPALSRRTKILKPEDIAREDIYIRLGNYRSSLAASLAWYKLKLQTRSWNNQLTPTASDFDSVVRDEKTGRLPLLLKPAQPLRIEEAALLCERLVDAGFGECGVDVVTTYQDGSNAASASEMPSKG